MVINRDKHNLFAARPDLSVYTTGATTSPMKVSSTTGGSTVVVSKGSGSGLTEEQATKLNSIEEGAQVNQNAYSKVTSGSSSIEATNPTDTLQIHTDGNLKVTLKDGIIKLEYIGPDNLWYKDADGNLWTDANVYSTKEISAYGFQGGEAGSGARYLYELNDVSSDVETPSNGNILRYDSNLNLWTLFDAKNLEVDLTPVYDQINELDTDIDALIKNVNSISKEVATNKSNIDSNKQRITSLEQNDIILNNLFDFVDGKIRANFDFYSLGEISAYGYNDGEAGSGSSYLHELNDVLLTSLTSGQLLQWDGNNWVNVNSDEIGFDETRLNQILIDYATKAWVESKGYLTQHQDLSTYATQKWVEDKKYITSSALSGYATEEWVTDKGYAVATDVASTYATIEALNKKLDKDKFAESFATEMAKWFIKDDTNKGIKPVNSYGLYSDTYVSAKGVSTGTGGSGGGGTSYDRLDSWAEYTSAKAGYVLSALLGYDLHTRVNNLASAGYITASALSGYAKLSDIPTVPTSLKNPYALSFGNKLYDGSAANTITASDLGALTSHQDISHLLSKTEAASTYQTIISSDNKIAYNNISGTPASLPASDVYSWAKAANKPSYAFSEITNKPTTLGGYGITDWDVNAYNGNDLNTFYDAGLKLIRNASFNYPSKGNYGSMLVMPYRKAFGNTTTDFAAQIFLPNGDDSANPNDMFFRTSLSSKWNEWQRVLTNNNYSEYTYSQTTLDGKLSGYLPLSGGTINGDLILDSKNNSRWLQFQTGSGTGYIGYRSNVDNWYLTNKNWANEYIVIHSGNIGSQSVNYASNAGDADTLDGYHSTAFTQLYIDNSDNFLSYTNRTRFQTSFITGQGDFCSLVIPTWAGNNENSWYLTELRFETGGGLKIRASKDGNVEYGWKTIATTESNVASATKLQTPRSIWGQSFDGSGDVSGNLSIPNGNSLRFALNNNVYTNVLAVDGSNNLLLGYGSSASGADTFIDGNNLYLRYGTSRSMGLILKSSGNVLIGTTVDNGAKLQVGGSVVASGSVTAKSSSDYRLKCEFDYDVDYQERLLSLGKVCDYRYTEHARQRNTGGVDGNRHTGLIWQDAKGVGLTNFAMTDEDGYGSLNYLSADYLNTITGAVQMTIIGVRSLLDRTEKIEDKVERLEKENEALRKEINDMRGGRYGC